MNFNVEQEYKEYQQRLLKDEENQVYKYNLDREYTLSQLRELDKEQMEKHKKAKSVAKKPESQVNIATFAANKKGEMRIGPKKGD